MKRKALSIITLIIIVLVITAGIFGYLYFIAPLIHEHTAVYKEIEEDGDTTKTVIYHIEDEPVYIEVEKK